MAFADITARIVALLEANRATLVAGLPWRQLAIVGAYPTPHFSDQALFVYRQGQNEFTYGRLGTPGQGAATTGEIDGQGAWAIRAQVRYPGGEEEAARYGDTLAWNLLTVLRGYTADTTNAYQSLLVTGTAVNWTEAPQGAGWYLTEEFTLRVRWEMTF